MINKEQNTTCTTWIQVCFVEGLCGNEVQKQQVPAPPRVGIAYFWCDVVDLPSYWLHRPRFRHANCASVCVCYTGPRGVQFSDSVTELHLGRGQSGLLMRELCNFSFSFHMFLMEMDTHAQCLQCAIFLSKDVICG